MWCTGDVCILIWADGTERRGPACKRILIFFYLWVRYLRVSASAFLDDPIAYSASIRRRLIRI